jgi:hypothetical protein
MKKRKVNFFEKGLVNPAVYRISRVLANSLNRVSTVFGKGHEMTVVFRKNYYAVLIMPDKDVAESV